MKPGAGQSRRREMDRFYLVKTLRAMQSFRVIAIEAFRVELLHHAETTEFAFVAIPIALVIAVFGGELAAGNLVDHLHTGHDLDRKRQPRAPARLRQGFISEIETSGRRVFDQGTGAGMVVPLVEQIGLEPASEVQKLVGAIGKGAEIVGPEEALSAVASHVDEPHGIDLGNRRRAVDHDGIGPPIAALVEPDRQPA
jgi:hypothetical protein